LEGAYRVLVVQVAIATNFLWQSFIMLSSHFEFLPEGISLWLLPS
jgi:hypothetical protein